MKRDWDELNLREAFGEMPAETRSALMKAARSVKEEEPVRRMTMRTVLIAACIILATMAAAVAAGSAFGWNEFFGTFYGDTKVPRAAQEILENTEERSYTLGGFAFRVQQLYADRHIAMASVQITKAEGEALLCMDACQTEPIGASGENGRQQAERLGVEPSLTWTEAAQKLNLPLYCVRAILDVDPLYSDGEEMEDVLYDADGRFVDYSMAALNSEAVGDSLPVQVFLRVAEINPETGEEMEVLSSREALTLAVSQPAETCDYTLTEAYTSGGLRLDAVHAELTPAGLYLTADFTAEGLTLEEMEGQSMNPVWYDENGEPYGWGMNLSYACRTDEWPKVSMMGMISVDSLPDTLIFSLEADGAVEEELPRLKLTR